MSNLIKQTKSDSFIDIVISAILEQYGIETDMHFEEEDVSIVDPNGLKDFLESSNFQKKMYRVMVEDVPDS